MHAAFRFKDHVNWVEFVDVRINMIFMLDMGYPDPSYFVRFGKWNDELQKEIVFNKEPVAICCDYDFLSRALADFIQTRQFVETRSYFDDLNFNLYCVPRSGDYQLVMFDLGAYNFFPEDDWDLSNGGIAIVFEPRWADLERLAWDLQTAELGSLVSQIDAIRKAVPHFALDELYNKYNRHLQTNLSVLTCWGDEPKPAFKPIELWRSGTYQRIFSMEIWEQISISVKQTFLD